MDFVLYWSSYITKLNISRQELDDEMINRRFHFISFSKSINFRMRHKTFQTEKRKMRCVNQKCEYLIRNFIDFDVYL